MFSKQFISLDIGSQNIKMACGKYRKNKVYINELMMTETPNHSIEDGNIIDETRLTDAIEELLDMNRVKAKEVIFTTNGADIMNREITVPLVEEEELDTVVQFEIQQYLPIVMKDYIIQYNTLGKIKDENSQGIKDRLKIFTITYPKRIVEQYLKLAESLELKPEALDVNFNAVSKLFKNDLLINEEAFSIEETAALIDMGAEKISVNIFSKGKMEFSRSVESGGSSIDKNLARVFEVSLKDGEKRKKEFSDLLEEKKEQHMGSLNAAIREIVDEWIEEIGKILQFYKNKKVGNKIDKIFIYGGTSKLNGFSSYMEKELNISVVNINSMSNVELSKNVIKENMYCFLNCIGALIRL